MNCKWNVHLPKNPVEPVSAFFSKCKQMTYPDLNLGSFWMLRRRHCRTLYSLFILFFVVIDSPP